MTYAPPPFSPPSHYAPPTVGPTAKYAGILLLLLGIITLAIGGLLVGLGASFDTFMANPQFQDNPDLQRQFAEFERLGIDVKLWMIATGAIVLCYAVPALVIAIALMRARTKVPATIAVVMVGMAMALMLFMVIIGIATMQIGGAAFWLVILLLHGLILMLLILAIRAPAPPMMMMPGPYAPPGQPVQPQYPRPMQGYQWQPPKQDQQPPRDAGGV